MSHILGFSKFNESDELKQQFTKGDVPYKVKEDAIRFLQHPDLQLYNKEFIKHIQTEYGALLGRLKNQTGLDLPAGAVKVISVIFASGVAARKDLQNWVNKIRVAAATDTQYWGNKFKERDAKELNKLLNPLEL